jgi:hypothetical protein
VPSRPAHIGRKRNSLRLVSVARYRQLKRAILAEHSLVLTTGSRAALADRMSELGRIAERKFRALAAVDFHLEAALNQVSDRRRIGPFSEIESHLLGPAEILPLSGGVAERLDACDCISRAGAGHLAAAHQTRRIGLALRFYRNGTAERLARHRIVASDVKEAQGASWLRTGCGRVRNGDRDIAPRI